MIIKYSNKNRFISSRKNIYEIKLGDFHNQTRSSVLHGLLHLGTLGTYNKLSVS